AERGGERRSAERVEDQPIGAVRFGGGKVAADDDAAAAPLGDLRALLVAADMTPDDRTGGKRELAGEMANPARGAVDEDFAAEEEAALAQRVQRGQPGDRQGRRLGVAAAVGQRRHRMAAAIDPL